jgi:hypothetical protein
MPIAPVVGAALIGSAAAVGGAAVASSASKKAANTQAQAAKDAASAQERAAALALEAQKTGTAEAVAAAKEAAKIAQTAQDAATKAAQDFSQAQYEETKGIYGQAFDSVEGAYDQAFTGAQNAYDQSYRTQLGFQQPYADNGRTAQDQIMQLLGLGGDRNAADFGQYAKSFGVDEFEQDPGYKFRLNEGMNALQRSAAARGNLLSGGTMKGIQRFGQDLASQEFSNAFQRAQIERGARLGALGNLAGAGQAASNNMTSIAGQYGTQSAGNALGRGQAMAGNALARGQAMSGNTADYYGTLSNLALGQGQNTAQNAYNVGQASRQGSMDLANAGSQSAYYTGNAQAQGAQNAGAARASGYVGSANAFNNALGQIAGFATQAPMNNAIMNYYNRKPAGSGIAPLSYDG